MRVLTATLIVLAAAAASLLAPRPAAAWGEYGHLTVCDLAYRKLTPASRSALDDLFQVRSGGIQVRAADGAVKRTYTSFNVGCLEEDSRPRRHPKDHFINLPRDAADVGQSCPPSPTTGAPRACALSGLQRDLAILRDAGSSRQDRVIALLAIGHWLGDIHQPLHISYEDDAGGNGIAVSFSGNCGPRSRPRNLHSVWDNCLLEAGLFEKVRRHADYKATWKPRTITYRAVDTLIANTSAAQ